MPPMNDGPSKRRHGTGSGLAVVVVVGAGVEVVVGAAVEVVLGC